MANGDDNLRDRNRSGNRNRSGGRLSQAWRNTRNVAREAGGIAREATTGGQFGVDTGDRGGGRQRGGFRRLATGAARTGLGLSAGGIATMAPGLIVSSERARERREAMTPEGSRGDPFSGQSAQSIRRLQRTAMDQADEPNPQTAEQAQRIRRSTRQTQQAVRDERRERALAGESERQQEAIAARRGMGMPTDDELGEGETASEAATPEFGQERVRPATSLRREDGRVTMTAEDGQGGTGEISFDEGARQRAQWRMGTLRGSGMQEDLPEPQGGTLSVVPADSITSVSPSQRAELRRARREAADRGDWDAVDRSFMTPAQREAADREQRRQSLRRDIRQTRGMDQSFDSMFQESLRRRNARSELAGMAEQDELAAEQQQQGFENQIAMRDQRLEELETRQDLSQQERENRLENIDRAFDFVERVSTGPDGEVDRDKANEMSRFLTRTGIAEQGVEATRRGADLYEQLDALDQEAGISSEDSTLERISSGLGGVAGGLASIYALARGGALARTAGTAGIVGSGALINNAMSEDGQEFPTFETPEEAVSALQELKEAGVEPRQRTRRGGLAIFPNETTEWRGQRINLSAMPAEMQQRLARILELVPEREQN